MIMLPTKIGGSFAQCIQKKPNYKATAYLFIYLFCREKGVVVFSLFGRQPKKETETKLKLVSLNKDLKQM